MSSGKGLDILEIAVHVIIILLGIIALVCAHGITDSFWQSLLVNVGSSLVVVTILFAIFEIFRRRNVRGGESTGSQYSGQSQKIQNERADRLMEQLRSTQELPITSDTRRTHRNSNRGK